MIRRFLPLATILAVGCGSQKPDPTATPFKGPDGTPVVIERLPVTRIVSTMQSATEWLVLLGKGANLVARTDYDKEPQLAHLPSIGGGLETSPETIAALQPDVVIGWRSGTSVALATALKPLGIPVVTVEATDTADTFAQLHTLALLVDEEQRSEFIADSIRSTLRSLTRTACPPDKKQESVLIEIWPDPPQTAGGTTWMSQLLGAACLENAFADLEAPWPNISMEALLDRQPDWILTSRGKKLGQRLAELRESPGWRDLDAVKLGHVLEIDGDIFSRSGPKMADWVKAVIVELQRLHG